MPEVPNPPVIVVTDDIVDLAVVARELPEGWPGVIRAEAAIPTGGGVVGLLAGPGSDVSAAAIDRLPDLRVVVVTSMGWDHVDVDAAQARDVTVVGIGPYCVDEVAEHTIALVLDLLRGITQLDATVRSGRWDYAGVGRPVRGTALGLIGLGRIGAAVAWRAAALGMEVAAYDPFAAATSAAATSTAATSTAATSASVRLVSSVEELVSASDVVSVHVPLSPETKNMVDGKLFGRFREGSYFVNVSRGEVVTEPALGEALRTGRLAGAALDVVAHEPPGPDDPVLGFPRTVLTPHAAWYSPAAIERLSRSAGHSLAAALSQLEVAR